MRWESGEIGRVHPTGLCRVRGGVPGLPTGILREIG
jgi:hypothetical protein